jgi:hypothetical protein
MQTKTRRILNSLLLFDNRDISQKELYNQHFKTFHYVQTEKRK